MMLLTSVVMMATVVFSTTADAAAATSDRISLNLPENVPLKVLVDYVSQRLQINVLYDEQIAAQKITIKSDPHPGPVPHAQPLAFRHVAPRR